MEAPKETCGTCRFYRALDGKSGTCRINPPVVVQDTYHDYPYSTWPDTYPHEWCGKWQSSTPVSCSDGMGGILNLYI